MNRRLIIGAALLAALALPLGACDRNDNKDPAAGFEQNLPSRIKSRPTDSREVEMGGPGNSVRVKDHVHLTASGDTAEVDYYTQGPGLGNIQHARVYFKQTKEEVASERKRLERDVTFDVDKTILSDRQYLDDGITLAHRGERSANGKSYESWDFLKDGVSYAAHRVTTKMPYGAGWELSLETLFYDNGKVQKQTEHRDDGLVVDEYSDAGVHVAHSQTDKYESVRSGEVYGPDGKTLMEKILQTYNVEVQKFEAGKLTEKFEFGWQYTVYTYTRVDSNGHMVLRQSYALKNATPDTRAGHVKVADYRIGSIEQFDGDGKLRKRITFGEDGKVDSVRERDDGPAGKDDFVPGGVQFFRPDGTLMRALRFSAEDKTLSAQDYPETTDVRAPAVDPTLLVEHPFDPPPAPLKNAYPYSGVM